MNRNQKEALIADLKEMFSSSPATFLVKYKGLSVSQIQGLRGQLRESNARLKVAKARLMKLAAADVDHAKDFAENFKDQVGLVFAKDEVSAAAKKIVNFAKDNEALDIVSGFFESKVLSKQEVEILASIPSREVLLAQLVGGMKAPASKLVCALNMIVLKLLLTVQEIAKKRESA